MRVCLNFAGEWDETKDGSWGIVVSYEEKKLSMKNDDARCKVSVGVSK